ncbi:MAG: electron transfer flavoprotein subunit beta/FixA family protein [Elusimicrobia bacterium]|nr:electron transfer flavoprotein subunit beta/FixA family protein [Elusimicrobiota bacterium]
MHIVVCVKQTPAATQVPVDAATGKLKTEGLPYGLNPWDEYAIEEAIRIKEKLAGSTVTVLSLGPARAEEAIRAAIALGCDEGAHLVDPSFDGTDNMGSSYLLSLGIRKLNAAKPVGLVLCGKQSNDNESGSVAPALGAWLDWPSVAYVRKFASIDEKLAKIERAAEDGTDSLEVDLPAVVSVIKEINEPRLPSLKGKMNSKKAPVAKWGAAELQAEAAKVSAGGRLEIVGQTPPPPRGGGIVVPGATAQEKAAFVANKLKELKFI